MAPPVKSKQQAVEPVPGVAVGDHVYFQHKTGPLAGRVLAHGKHGCTIDADGEQHRVKWDGVLGHKQRAQQRYEVVDEGEDGMIVQDAGGNRRYFQIPPEGRADQMVVKADGRASLLLKAGPIANRPGLHLQEITDKAGRRSKHWVRNSEKPGSNRKAAPKADGEKPGAAAGYGTHNLEVGDSISFALGELKGKGKIKSIGKDGVMVEDSTGHPHGVPWKAISGHEPGPATKKPEHERPVLGRQKPIAPDKFDAATFAQSHDQADVTPEAILSHFPDDTAEKITAVQERLKMVEQTIDTFKDEEGNYTPERAALHEKIIDSLLSDERIKAATPADGQPPTFTILGGRGGSGKSWFEGNVYDPDKAIVLDADHIKGMLPEYEGWNAAQIHEESGEIFDRLVELSRELGLNVVLDKTMKTAKSAIADVTAFKEAGYRTEAHYMHLPRQEAAKRAVARFLGKTQRYVPVDVVLSNTTNEGAFDQVRQLVDDWSFRDNNVKQGEQPILISQRSGVEDSGEQLTKSDTSPIFLVRRIEK